MSTVMTDPIAFSDDLARSWLAGGPDAPSALVYREFLAPAEGRGEPFFPPTFAGEEGGSGYNIDTLSDGSRVALVDSHGAQANRIEPLFKDPPLAALVPKVTVTAGDKTVDLLDAGHRAADAIVRFSSLAGTLNDAFRAWRDRADARPLAKVAPTSLVLPTRRTSPSTPRASTRAPPSTCVSSERRPRRRVRRAAWGPTSSRSTGSGRGTRTSRCTTSAREATTRWRP